jgi:hypothetical protein
MGKLLDMGKTSLGDREFSYLAPDPNLPQAAFPKKAHKKRPIQFSDRPFYIHFSLGWPVLQENLLTMLALGSPILSNNCSTARFILQP